MYVCMYVCNAASNLQHRSPIHPEQMNLVDDDQLHLHIHTYIHTYIKGLSSTIVNI